MPELAIVILAGGDATRLPGKLERRVGERSLLEAVYDNLRGDIPVCIATQSSFSRDIDARLDCPFVIDRWPGRGPLGALVSTFGVLHARRIFAVAGDAPAVTRDVLRALLEAWRDGDEAAIPEHDGGIEPLAALYDRVALLREGFTAMERRAYALHGVLDRLNARHVPFVRDYFINVNTQSDLARIAPGPSKGTA